MYRYQRGWVPVTLKRLYWSECSVSRNASTVITLDCMQKHKDSGHWQTVLSLTLNIQSLARQRCLPSCGPRRTPWFFCNFSTVRCGRLFKLCFLGFWNYNSAIQALLVSNILCLFISTEVTGGTELLHTHSSLIQHLNNVIFWAFSAGHFSNLQRSELKNDKSNIPHL